MHRRTLAGSGLGAAGLVLAGIQLTHAIQQTDIPVAIAVDALPFAAMGLALVYAGYWLARDDTFEETATRVVIWGAGATVAFAAVAALLLFSQQVAMGSLDRAAYLTVDIITVGALTGVLVGLYDAQSRNRLHELETERDRVEAFGRKAADVNNYGRAIATAGSDELARAVREEPRGDVVAHERAAPVDLGETVSDVLTAVVTEDGGTTTVVVAVDTGDAPTDEQDQRLLELVVAHATVRLDRLATQQPAQ